MVDASIHRMRVLAGLEQGRPGLPRDVVTEQLKKAANEKVVDLVKEFNEWSQKVADEAFAKMERAQRMMTKHGSYLQREDRVTGTRIVNCLKAAYAATADLQVEADELIERTK